MKNRVFGSGSTGASREQGERLAVSALGFLAADSERLSRFLSLSGLGPHNLRAAAADPKFLAAVLDYFLADEPLLLTFAADQGRPPETIAAARRAMSDPSSDPP